MNIIKTLLLLTSLTSWVFSEVNHQMTQQRHLMDQRYAGLSNTGVAIPDPVSSATMNPSLVHHFHINSKTKVSISAGFDRDSIFNKMILTGGASYFINERTTIAAQYRNLMQSKNKLTNEAVLTVAGTLFDKGEDDNQGGVDVGMNMRYLQTKWNENYADPLNIMQKITDSNKVVISDNVSGAYSPSGFNKTDKDEYRLLFDVGFFQDNIVNNLDLGIVFYNLFGFQWDAKTPTVSDSSKYSIGDTTEIANDTITDSLYYTGWQRSNGKNHKSYKRMTIGLAYHLPVIEKKLDLLIPMDFEWIGMFNKKEDTEFLFHMGLEVWVLRGIIGIRGGYSSAPSYVRGEPQDFDIDKTNILTAGASIRIKMFGIDGYFTEYKKEWGISGFVAF